MFLRFFFLATVVVFATCVSADPFGDRVMVIVDDFVIQETHSMFFNSLKARGYQLSFFTADDPSLKLREYGEFLYDHLVLFAPGVQVFGGSVDATTIVAFIDAGHNVIIGADSTLGDPVRDIASECGVQFDEASTYVIDHLNFDESDFDGDHTMIVADDFIQSSVILGQQKHTPVLFQGIGQDVENNDLLYTVLKASSSAYSHSLLEPVVEAPHVVGRDTVLVSALQARNNARVTISGSLDLFSDAFFTSAVRKYAADGKVIKHEKSGNELFCEELSKWTFQERGILRARDVQHHLVDRTLDRPYRVNDDIVYSVVIEEWSRADRQWKPFIAQDVQLEFQMLDPYIRTYLTPDAKGLYAKTFTTPDVYGIFTFRIEYYRLGYGRITSLTRVPVRPYRHDEYERFIASAYPYYASSLSMMAGVFLFSLVFLNHREQ